MEVAASDISIYHRSSEIVPIAGSDLDVQDVHQSNSTVWPGETQHLSRKLHEEFPRFIPYVPLPDRDSQASGKSSDMQRPRSTALLNEHVLCMTHLIACWQRYCKDIHGSCKHSTQPRVIFGQCLDSLPKTCHADAIVRLAVHCELLLCSLQGCSPECNKYMSGIFWCLASLCAWGMSSCLSGCYKVHEDYQWVWFGEMPCRRAHLLRVEGR